MQNIDIIIGHIDQYICCNSDLSVTSLLSCLFTKTQLNDDQIGLNFQSQFYILFNKLCFDNKMIKIDRLKHGHKLSK